MDIIASHQHGLAEQLAQEAAGLAGRPGDAAQRAIVGHHLYQHSGGTHRYALIASAASLALDRRLARLARHVRRWKRRDGALAGRLETFANNCREIDRERCEALLLAYRLATTPGVRCAALCDAELAAAMAEADLRVRFLAIQRWAEARWGGRVEAAIDSLAWAKAPRDLGRVVASLRLSIGEHDSADKRGWARAERALIADKALPPGFAANPGQHYYTLQRSLADKRRKKGDAGLDLPPEQTVAIAA